MGRYRAPQHRLDHAPRWIDPEDDAWDASVVAAAYKRQTIRVDGELVDLAPLRRYLMAQSRFDLEAPDLQRVLQATGCLDLERAEVWTLRVLPYRERSKAFQHYRASFTARASKHFGIAERELAAANEHAFVHGVVALQSPRDDAETKALRDVLEALPEERSHADWGQLLEAVSAVRFSAIADVGAAIRDLSDDLLEDERRV